MCRLIREIGIAVLRDKVQFYRLRSGASKSRHLLGGATLITQEGEGVSYELGPNYEVRFEIGTVLLNQRLMLRNFQILERLGDLKKSLLHTHINLKLGKTLVLGSADSSLAVAVVCDPPTVAHFEPAERSATDKVGLGGR